MKKTKFEPDFLPTVKSGWAGLIAICIWLYMPKQETFTDVGILILLIAISTLSIESISLYKTKKGLFSKQIRNPEPKRIILKCVGGAATLLTIAFAYWIFPEYQHNFYDNYYKALYVGLPLYIIIGIFSIWFFDSRNLEPHDIYYNIGVSITSFKKIPTQPLIQHVCQTTIKAFFLPLMLIYLIGNVNYKFPGMESFNSFYESILHFTYLVDTSFTVVGYYSASRLFNSHIRSAEPTAGGWISAIICYQPFWSLISAGYIAYIFSPTWGVWLSNSPVLHLIWGISIIICLLIFTWATMSFGSRFSNLTHRGIINFGPYAYCKHPAYISKLLSYLLIQVPWAAESSSNAIKGLSLWALLAVIYYCRAKTEEKHLRSVDNTYAIYEKQLKQRWSN
jgi:protein-S-isoprenylcysteine O-methyltransferase Ste14